MSQQNAHNMECGKVPKVFQVWLLWVFGPYNCSCLFNGFQTSGSSWKRVCDAFWLPTDCLHTRLGSGYKLFNVFVCKLDVHLPFGNDNKTSALMCRLSKHERYLMYFLGSPSRDKLPICACKSDQDAHLTI
jgi:hypothetical protein